MKLVDILARELKEWPEGAESLDQSVVDREVYAYSRDGGGLLSLSETGIFLTVLAEDTDNEVTRAKWQAAVDALNKPAALEWDGKGRPPVGIEIECSYPMWGYWLKGKVLCYGEQMIFMEQESSKGNGKFEGSMNPDGIMFRPIRTPEQIAAEEREQAIREMCEHGIDAGDHTIEMTAAALYDAGYRKQEPN